MFHIPIHGYCFNNVICLQPGGADYSSQILKDQLTLSQPGEADYAHHITTDTPGLSDLPSALFSEWLTKAYVIISRKKYLKGLLSRTVFFGDQHGQIKGQQFIWDLLKLIGLSSI